MKYYYVTICSILTRIVLNSLSKSCGGFEQRPNTNHFNKITKNNQHAPRINHGGQFDNFCKIGKLDIANRHYGNIPFVRNNPELHLFILMSGMGDKNEKVIFDLKLIFQACGTDRS